MSLMCSNNITVVLAIERYIAVTRPIEYHINVTSSGSSPWRRVALYMVPTVAFSILFNIPKFFEFSSEYVIHQVEVPVEAAAAADDLANNNLTQTANVTKVELRMTDLRTDSNYSFYYVHLARLFVTGIIPISALIYLNSGIYK